MDAEGIMDVGIMDVGITGAEGGDMACFRWSLSCSGQAPSSTEYTALGRLMIHTDTGTIIIGIRATDPVTPSALGNMIGCLISDMDSTLRDTISKGDDE